MSVKQLQPSATLFDQVRAVLGWAGLGWAGLGWDGLGWAGLRCAVLHEIALFAKSVLTWA